MVNDDPITGKAVDEGGRTTEFRGILKTYFANENGLSEIISQIPRRLSRIESPPSRDNRTFASGWDERLARTQISHFYNQAVLERLDERGYEECYVPNSEYQKPESDCTIHLAGNTEKIKLLKERLERAYQHGNYHGQPMVPDHPHCTHTVTPPTEN